MALFFDATFLVPPIRYNKGERKGYGMEKDLFALETVRKEIEDLCESAEGGVLRLEDYFTPDLDPETNIDLVAEIPSLERDQRDGLARTCADRLAAMKRLLEIPEEKREEAIAKALAGEGRIAAFCKIYLEPIRIKELREEDQELLERVQNSDMTGEETTPEERDFYDRVYSLYLAAQESAAQKRLCLPDSDGLVALRCIIHARRLLRLWELEAPEIVVEHEWRRWLQSEFVARWGKDIRRDPRP